MIGNFGRSERRRATRFIDRHLSTEGENLGEEEFWVSEKASCSSEQATMLDFLKADSNRNLINDIHRRAHCRSVF
jgi:hypothetical protein